MRIDRFVSLHGYGSRKSAKKLFKQMRVKLNGQVITQYRQEITGNDHISIDDKEIPNLPYIAIVMNKPAGYMCSMRDERYPSVLNLIDEFYRKRVRIVGRLDQDTEGLLILTDNGILNARLTNPKSEISKVYLVKVNHLLKPELPEIFARGGIDIGRDEITRPAELEIVDEYTAYITIHEGKYHEIKRLFGKFNYDVVYLKRVSFGTLKLDDDLELGDYRLLREEEYDLLLKSVHLKKEDLL